MRYGVILPADGRLLDWQISCVAQLRSAGHGEPAWSTCRRHENRKRPRLSGALANPDRTSPPAPSPEPLSAVDFILNFSAHPCDDQTASMASRFGVWQCSFERWAPSVWRCLLSGRESVVVALHSDSADLGGARQLEEGAVILANSWRESRERICGVMAVWPAHVATELALSGADSLLGYAAISTPPPRPLSGSELAWGLAAYPFRMLSRWWRRLICFDTWNVGIVSRADAPRTLSDLADLHDVRWLPPRRALYLYADPFPYRHNGREWILMEAYGHPKGVKGEIVCVALPDESGAHQPHSSIVRSTHLSYPYTFEDGEDVYCVPEMHREDGCIIYRIDADGQWKPAHHILRDYKFVDPTVIRRDGRWWLFCTGAESNNMSLLGFYAETLAGPWTAHPLNPLKCDTRSARPAGRPFELDGRLYRPAQDCSETYGGAVVIMEILRLSPRDFLESAVMRLEADPGWPYPDGLHHLVIDGSRIYIDAKKRHAGFFLWLMTQITARSPSATSRRGPQ